MLIWLVFFFIAFGAKLLLACAMIYLLIPASRTCDRCDCETIPTQMGAPGRAARALTFGSLQRRWCPRCEWEGMTRTGVYRRAAALAAVVQQEEARR
jgi:hypothetical protein